ncbi:MAG: hypothetical protein BMS9Abin31_0481 [Gammaproteobacteria bacterium]|nr:MAG: hypothetical protein BMS9Abin31_0481 [Gammaproteobacteria bacterium]
MIEDLIEKYLKAGHRTVVRDDIAELIDTLIYERDIHLGKLELITKRVSELERK